jgi:hypothetical protein
MLRSRKSDVSVTMGALPVFQLLTMNVLVSAGSRTAYACVGESARRRDSRINLRRGLALQCFPLSDTVLVHLHDCGPTLA